MVIAPFDAPQLPGPILHIHLRHQRGDSACSEGCNGTLVGLSDALARDSPWSLCVFSAVDAADARTSAGPAEQGSLHAAFSTLWIQPVVSMCLRRGGRSRGAHFCRPSRTGVIPRRFFNARDMVCRTWPVPAAARRTHCP